MENPGIFGPNSLGLYLLLTADCCPVEVEAQP